MRHIFPYQDLFTLATNTLDPPLYLYYLLEFSPHLRLMSHSNPNSISQALNKPLCLSCLGGDQESYTTRQFSESFLTLSH